MILLRDFALDILPGLVAAAGWLYALSLRRQVRRNRELQRTVTSCARTNVRKCS
jgi:hypothetical protein